jgi:phosphonoacetaldehyde hydrolase
VGVVASSALVGLSKPEFDELSGPDREERLSAARNALMAAGAHYTINIIEDLPDIITQIDYRLVHEEEPTCSTKNITGKLVQKDHQKR